MPAYYIVLRESIPGVEAVGLEGRALSKHSVEIEALAKKAGVIPLLTFFSSTPEEVAGLLDDPVQKSVQIPEERWFSAEEGLNTISALLKSLAEVPRPDSLSLAKN